MGFFKERPDQESPINTKPDKRDIAWEDRSDVRTVEGQNPHQIAVYKDERDAVFPFKTAEVYLQNDKGWDEYEHIQSFRTEEKARTNYHERLEASTQRIKRGYDSR